MRIPLAKDGLPYVIGLLLISGLLLWHFPIAALFCLVTSICVAAFFRDPERDVVLEEGAMLSPADGRIISITDIADGDGAHGPHRRLAVFMSVFNCHVNRSPIKGVVEDVEHTPGRFNAAFARDAGEVNERNAIRVIDETGEEVLFTQIAGLIARRIVCQTSPGDQIEPGQRIGLIKFGSRVDVVIPPTYSICVNVGDKVKAGLHVIARRLDDDLL
ncbi:MAG: phosphatidylserine decarboxylase, partial [Candidatus Coatesbacteria bacterium]|nr:phosphatidylserine decarboxylase [Candidatus Coatesbacteria bacterium]